MAGMRDSPAGKHACIAEKDCTINLRCDIITMGGWVFSLPREERRWSSAHGRRGARVIFTALPELERINNKILAYGSFSLHAER